VSDGQTHGERNSPFPKKRKGNIKIRLTKNGPWVDLGCNANDLIVGSLETLGRITGLVDPQYVSPILSHALKKIRDARRKAEPPVALGPDSGRLVSLASKECDGGDCGAIPGVYCGPCHAAEELRKRAKAKRKKR
jgi:hypothetical protein